MYGKASKPSVVYQRYPWKWQNPLEVTSDQVRQLVINKANRDDIILDILRPFPQKNWGLVFDPKAQRRFQPKMIRFESKDLDIFGNFIISGIDEAGRLRGLVEQEVQIIMSLQPMWKILVENKWYPESDSSDHLSQPL